MNSGTADSSSYDCMAFCNLLALSILLFYLILASALRVRQDLLSPFYNCSNFFQHNGNLPSSSAECPQELGINSLRNNPQPVRESLLTASYIPCPRVGEFCRVFHMVPQRDPSGPELQFPTVVTHSLVLSLLALFPPLSYFPCSLIWDTLPNCPPTSKSLSQGLASYSLFPKLSKLK